MTGIAGGDRVVGWRLGGAAQAQDILLGNLPAGAGPFATLAKTNEIAAQMAVDEINAAGGIDGKKLKIVSFDTAGKPDQAVVGLRKLAEDDKVMAIIGPFSSGECRVAFAAGERAGIVTMSMASSAPKLAEPFTYGLRNTSDEGYMFQRVMKTLQGEELSDRDRRGRLRDRRRDLQDHGRDRAAEHHEGVRHRDEGQRHVPDPGVRSVGPGVAAQGRADRSDRRRLGPGGRDPPGAGNAPAGRQGPAGRRLDHRRFRACRSAWATNGNGTDHPDHVLRRRRATKAKAFEDEFIKRAKAAGIERSAASQFDAATYDIVMFYAHAMKEAKVTGDPGQARCRAHRDPRHAARDAALSGAGRADLVRQERRRAQARLHHRDAGRQMEPDRDASRRDRDGQQLSFRDSDGVSCPARCGEGAD